MTGNFECTCPFCGSAGDFREFTAREMLLGLRESFVYRECAACGSLHIREVPPDLARFYPSNYYSFRPAFLRRPNAAATAFRRIYARWIAESPGAAADRRARKLAYHRWAFLYWARLCRVGLNAHILDLGCGGGILIARMREFGFTHLTGADPFAPGEVEEQGFKVFRSELAGLKGGFDLIMMHHTLEHVADPRQTLVDARERLRPGGKILVRIPVAGSEAHRRYGADWFNLDPPRHLAIPSLQGIAAVAARAGLKLTHTGFDSQPSSFLNSENYQRNIAGPEARKPPRALKRQCRRQMYELDAARRGDCGVFVLATS